MIKVVLLGKYREQVGIEQLELDACSDFAAFEQTLLAHAAAFAEVLADKRLLIAVNHTLVSRAQFAAQAGDEVALMPPVTGG